MMVKFPSARASINLPLSFRGVNSVRQRGALPLAVPNVSMLTSGIFRI
jgi:hypothetical protein